MFGPPQCILDHQEWQIVLFFFIILCLEKLDNMLTKENKYRYEIAIFYRYGFLPIFELFDLTDTDTDFCIWIT